jgi:hypothetical protein
VIVEEMETTSGTKAISFTLPCYRDVVPKCFSGKRNVLNVLDSLETSSGQAVEDGFNPIPSTGSTTHTVEDTRTQIKYQQLTQTGFETGWHAAPLGSTSWLTVENDNAHPPTAEEFFPKDDRVLKYCLFISKLRTMYRELCRAGTVETSSRKYRDGPPSQRRHDNYTTGSSPQVRECHRYFLYRWLVRGEGDIEYSYWTGERAEALSLPEAAQLPE